MKIKVRTLKENNNEYDVQPTDTIQSLKVLIAQKQACEVESQTLIFAGKILANDKTIEECGIKNDDFLVLMVKKTAAKPATTTAPTGPATTTSAPPSEKPPQTQQTQTESTTDQKNASESLLTGSDLESSINNIVGMGFTRELVVEAMKEAFNNPSRAVDLLTSGWQPSQATSPPPAQPQTSTPVSSQPQPQQSRPPASGGGSVFDGLKQHPQFPMLCMLAQQGGEEALRKILEYFAQVSPPLLQLIVQNQEEFIRLLSTPVTQAEAPPQPAATGPTTPGVVRLTVTPEDERAIHNIVSMGFDRNRVLEAYFLFEKDEAQTINFLLNNPDTDN
jgi:UV excision repair protein RAD23